MVERSADTRHLILFDGGCGFCARAVAIVAPRVDEGTFRYAPLASDEARKLLDRRGVAEGCSDTLFVVPSASGDRGALLAKSAAVVFVVSQMRWPWRALAVLGWLPGRLLDWGYDQAARSRFMLSGSSEHCSLPATALDTDRMD